MRRLPSHRKQRFAHSYRLNTDSPPAEHRHRTDPSSATPISERNLKHAALCGAWTSVILLVCTQMTFHLIGIHLMCLLALENTDSRCWYSG